MRQEWYGASNCETQSQNSRKDEFALGSAPAQGYFVTLNPGKDVSVVDGVVTTTGTVFPAVKPAGTVTEISVAVFLVMVAAMPLKVTLVAPVNLLPRI